MTTSIYFPHLHIFLENVGKTIMIGNFGIALYGIVIACGMMAGILMAVHEAKRTGQKIMWIWQLLRLFFPSLEPESIMWHFPGIIIRII